MNMNLRRRFALAGPAMHPQQQMAVGRERVVFLELFALEIPARVEPVRIARRQKKLFCPIRFRQFRPARRAHGGPGRRRRPHCEPFSRPAGCGRWRRVPFQQNRRNLQPPHVWGARGRLRLAGADGLRASFGGFGRLLRRFARPRGIFRFHKINRAVGTTSFPTSYYGRPPRPAQTENPPSAPLRLLACPSVRAPPIWSHNSPDFHHSHSLWSCLPPAVARAPQPCLDSQTRIVRTLSLWKRAG